MAVSADQGQSDGLCMHGIYTRDDGMLNLLGACIFSFLSSSPRYGVKVELFFCSLFTPFLIIRFPGLLHMTERLSTSKAHILFLF